MKARLGFVIAILLTTAVRADWMDVKVGMTPEEVWKFVGAPLIQNHGHGTAVWTYDAGGYVMFSFGRVTFFEPSKLQPGWVTPQRNAQEAHATPPRSTDKPTALKS
jgi:hypothetical protein